MSVLPDTSHRLAELGPLSLDDENVAYWAVRKCRFKSEKKLRYLRWIESVRAHFGGEPQRIFHVGRGQLLVGVRAHDTNQKVPPEIAELYWAWENFRDS